MAQMISNNTIATKQAYNMLSPVTFLKKERSFHQRNDFGLIIMDCDEFIVHLNF
jgi:hypothetical protein